MENVDVFCRREFCLLISLTRKERSLISKATNLLLRKSVYKDLMKSLILAPILFFFWASNASVNLCDFKVYNVKFSNNTQFPLFIN